MQWNEFERGQANALKAKEEADLECFSCPKCGSQWFEQLRLFRFPASHNLVLGQDVPPKPGAVGYVFLRCGLCQNVIEPRVQHYARDLAASDYDYCLDTLEGKFDTRKKAEEKKKEEAEDAIESEEL